MFRRMIIKVITKEKAILEKVLKKTKKLVKYMLYVSFSRKVSDDDINKERSGLHE